MTKHTMVTLRLHRKGVILLAVFAVLFAILIFFAGWLLGTRRGEAIALAKLKAPKIAPPKIAIPKIPSATAKAAAAPPGTATTTPPPSAAVAIRVGMFPAEADAKALVERLAAQKVIATIAPLPTDAGPTLYLVLVGRYASRRDAATAAARLSEELAIDTAVVPVE